MYRKIRKKLRKFFRKSNHRFFVRRSFKRRLKLLTAAVCGMMRKQSSSMAALGYGLPQVITAHSREKTMKRFVENEWIDYETYYMPIIKKVLRDIFKIKPHLNEVHLVIDGSKMGSSHMSLKISLWFRGRGIPLVWQVVKKPKGHFKAQTHLDLFERLRELLAPYLTDGRTVIFMGDGEFDTTVLQDGCEDEGWKYVFRTACDTVFHEDGSRFQPKDLQVPAGQKMLFVADTEFSEKRRKHVNFVLWHDEKYEEALPLISNLDEPIDITEAYAKRYSIEGMFKDLKSTTFNLHKTRLTKAYSISNLIMIAAIALLLTIMIGCKYEKSKLRPYINRIRADRTVNTMVTYGRDFIDYCLDHDIKFSFSYKFSMNSP